MQNISLLLEKLCLIIKPKTVFKKAEFLITTEEFSYSVLMLFNSWNFTVLWVRSYSVSYLNFLWKKANYPKVAKIY